MEELLHPCSLDQQGFFIWNNNFTMNTKNNNRTKFAVGHFLTENPDDPASFSELARRFADRLREVYFPWPGLANARITAYNKPDDEACFIRWNEVLGAVGRCKLTTAEYEKRDGSKGTANRIDYLPANPESTTFPPADNNEW